MSKEIEFFLMKLKNWKENFEIKSYQKKSENEIAKIVEMQMNKDVDGLLKIWEDKLKQEYFEMPHPEYPEVMTRAVKNIQYGMANFIFMVDAQNNNSWIIAQCVSFIDLIITQNFILETSTFGNPPIYAQIDKLSKLSPQHLVFDDINYGFLLSQTRPYHFFYDHYKYLIYFQKKQSNHYKSIVCNESFFRTTKIDNKESNKVFLFPATIGNNQLNQAKNDVIKQLNEQMEKAVYEDATQDFVQPLKEEGTLKLWYGITGQKRSWLQQIEAAELIVKHLLQYFPKIEFYIDGMTAPEGKVIKNKEDEEVFNKIALNTKCKIDSLIGRDYRHKIQVCSTVDIFIANGGTGCMVPLRFCKKPGVVHSNTKLFSFPDKYPNTVKFIEKKLIVEVLESDKAKAMLTSYHIPWQHIFNLTAEVLNLTKGINIELLEVPLVEEVVKEYELKKQQEDQMQKNKVFKNLQNSIKSEHQAPDLLREVALAFEQSGDIVTALSVMQKALELRPNGPFIKKKVEEYTKLMEQQK